MIRNVTHSTNLENRRRERKGEERRGDDSLSELHVCQQKNTPSVRGTTILLRFVHLSSTALSHYMGADTLIFQSVFLSISVSPKATDVMQLGIVSQWAVDCNLMVGSEPQSQDQT